MDVQNVVSGVSPFMKAVKVRHVSVVDLMLEKRANIDAIDSHRATPLIRAAELGHERRVDILLRKEPTSTHWTNQVKQL